MTLRTGDARFPRTNYKTSRYCVAYLDFLGGTDIIRHDDQNKHLNIINMIFEDAKKAEKVYKKFAKNIADGDDGEEKGITYTVSSVKKSSKYVVMNVYLEKDKLLIVYGSLKDTDILEDFCDELKLPTDF